MSSIIVNNINEAIVQIRCPDDIAHELHDIFTFKVPNAQFRKKGKKKWDGSIHLFNMMDHTILRGLVPFINSFAKKNNIPYTDDAICEKSLTSSAEARLWISEALKLPFEPYDHQVKALITAVNDKRSLILSPVNSGKSLNTYMISRRLLENEGCKKGLVIVPSIQLVHQLYSDFHDYSKKNSWNVNHHVTKIFGGESKYIQTDITISTWQSLFRMPEEYFHQFDFVIGDEAHLYSAKSVKRILESMVNARYRIGMTGSLDGIQTNEMTLMGLFGPIKKMTTTKKLQEQKISSEIDIKVCLLQYDREIKNAMFDVDYQTEINWLLSNEKRNLYVARLAIHVAKTKVYSVMLVRKDYGKMIKTMIESMTDLPVFYVDGTIDVDTREDIRKDFDNVDNAIFIATFGTTSFGVNIKKIFNLIFPCPFKSQIRVIQSIGRGLRIHNDKHHLTLYDIGDDLSFTGMMNYTLRHMIARLRIYKQEEFKFKISKIPF